MSQGIHAGQYIRPAPPAATFCLTASEGERFLQIIAQSARIRRHYDLFQLLQGEVQYFLPHQILISAWGDLRGPKLQLDVISAIPGVRTGRLDGCDVGGLLNGLYLRWVAEGRRPLLLDNTTDGILMHSACDCALHRSLRGVWSFLLHGIHDARDGTDCLYLTANAGSIAKGADIERFRFLADAVITLIDAGSRRVAGLTSRATTTNLASASRLHLLSAREEEILTWVSKGRTNFEIAEILAISAFTVKNHVQRILRKLGAANRTEAVAKYRQKDRPVQRKRAVGDAVLVAE